MRTDNATAYLPLNMRAIFFVLCCLALSAAFAEVVTDGSTGPVLSLKGPVFGIESRLGRLEGKNLFHSFSTFNLSQGESAVFSGPLQVERVIGRMTGGEASYLDGILRCTIPNADLYLFNPAGISFGPHAGLDVQGSFYGASADYLGFTDGSRFNGESGGNSHFSSAAPGAFGFLSPHPAPIRKDRSFLQVPAGKTLALMGGDLLLKDKHDAEEADQLSAPGGKIQLVATGAPAEIPLGKVANMPLSGDLRITDLPLDSDNAGHPANLDVSGTGGGEIILQGGRITLDNIYAFSDTADNGDGGKITIRAADFAARGGRVTSETLPAVRGQGGTIDVHAQRVTLRGGAQISTTTRGSGSSGGVKVTAEEKISISGKQSVFLYGQERATPFPSGLQSISAFTGKGGAIELQAPQVEIYQDGAVSSFSNSYGPGGSIDIHADTLTLSNRGKIEAGAKARGHGGSIQMEVGTLRLENSTIGVAAEGAGNAGNLNIQVNDSMHLRNHSMLSARAEISGGGNISVTGPAQSLYVDNSLVSAHAGGDDKEDAGGNVIIRNDGFFILKKSRVLASAEAGDGGNIKIASRRFVRSGESILDASSKLGVDGTVLINSPDTHLMESLVPAPALLDARALHDNVCQMRDTSDLSRFLQRLYGGASTMPDDWLESPFWPAFFPANKEVESVLGTLQGPACTAEDTARYGRYAGVQTRLKALLEELDEPVQRALLHSHAADLWLAVQRPAFAEYHLNEASYLLEFLQVKGLQAHILNNWGNWHAGSQNYHAALDAYTQAERSAMSNPVLLMRILLNIERVSRLLGNGAFTLVSVQELQKALQNLPENKEKAFLLAAAGKLGLDASHQFLATAYPWLNQSLKLAMRYEDTSLKVHVNLYLAAMYTKYRRYREALYLNQRAWFNGQNKIALLYRIQWQRGYLLQKLGRMKEAGEAYLQALHTLETVRAHLNLGQKNTLGLFEQHIQPVYFSMAELFLRRAEQSGKEQQQIWLEQVKAVLEKLRTVELENYFQDTCVSQAQNKLKHPLQIARDTLVIYPLILSDRLELLVQRGERLHRFTVEASVKDIRRETLRFSRNLQKAVRWGFQQQAQQLYQWLIKPLHPVLDGVKQLVIVPDGILRTIPFAALHDGEKYLIEQFSVVITPALSLTDNNSIIAVEKQKMLLNGLSLQVLKEFPGLPGVEREIKQIKQHLEHKKVLLNRDFISEKFSDILQKENYHIVHVASHGQFDRDPKRSFLLAYDTKLDMDYLENVLRRNRAGKEKLDLLTLSACQTATGDERAALGLAGMAVKAGARSALASLWSVSDDATVKLMDEFYRALSTGLSKASALQKSQQSLLQNRKFQHPVYWSAFVLIGGWGGS